MNYSLLRNLLFLLSPETSHHAALSAIHFAEKLKLLNILFPKPEDKPVNVMGIDFPNPVGLAAGLDKNGDYIDALAALGFGFLEIGTVTPRPQPGNPKPRLFRLPEYRAIINRMGFNNKGIDYLIDRIKVSHYSGVLGINIGKNFDTPVEKALDDYLTCLRKAYEYASYITVNVSSPNTPGLRNLQFGDSLIELLSGLKEEQAKLAQQQGVYKPLTVKIAPDMNEEETRLVARAVLDQEIDAVIATNTTLLRDTVQGHKHANEAGGLSGKPVAAISTETVNILSRELAGKVPVIGVGGIEDVASAKAKFDAGAALVQVYTGFIYQGPALIRRIVEAL